MRRISSLPVLSFALSACISGSDVGADDVVRLEACPPEGVACDAAALLADGRTPIGIKVSTPAQSPRTSSLDTTVMLSAGTWVASATPGQPTVAKFSLTAQGSRVLAFVPTTAIGYVQVTAELAGFTSTIFPLLKAAPLMPPDVELNPTTLGTATTVRVTARVRAATGGQPSDGTRVSFLVDAVTPAGTLAFFSPTLADVQPDHMAASTLTTDARVTQVRIRVRALPPDTSTPPMETVMNIVRP